VGANAPGVVGDALDVLVARVKTIAGGKGFTSSALYGPDNRTLEVVWKAPAPGALLALNGMSINGYLIRVRESVLSQDDLITISDQLLEMARTGELPEIASITGNGDQSGLIVAVARIVGDPTELQAAYARAAGVPTAVIEAESPKPTKRRNDGHLWRGGSLYRIRTYPNPYAFCTTGFPVLKNGQARLLSARHCAVKNNLWDDVTGDPLTNARRDARTRPVDDTMIIDPDGGTQGRVSGGFGNAARASTNYTFDVAGAGSPSRNAKLCTSGANSGMHCGLTVLDSTMQTWACGRDNCHGWRARVGVRRALRGLAAAGGDSGGPVFQIRRYGQVSARGIIYGGSDSVRCRDVRWSVTNCYATVWFTDIERVLRGWGASIQTVG
jgi:hypothetical protein